MPLRLLGIHRFTKLDLLTNTLKKHSKEAESFLHRMQSQKVRLAERKSLK
jgi:hypothetical protein